MGSIRDIILQNEAGKVLGVSGTLRDELSYHTMSKKQSISAANTTSLLEVVITNHSFLVIMNYELVVI
ncbi:MAG: hypothetical protein V7K21_05085 [Nostoc sp.]|uniref:hypothetical protein n=1 Tax=Nostoc sp. TaxID=1180 RepID=UPI002FFC8C3D